MKGMLAMILLDLYGCFVLHGMPFAAVVAAAAIKFIVHVITCLS